jgi:hypothetical protein
MISDFKTIRQSSPRYNVVVEATARSEAIENGDASYGLNDTVNILEYFIDYLQIQYPLPKSSSLIIEINFHNYIEYIFFINFLPF